MDKVLIRGLKAQSCIGVHAWERKIRQTLIIDLELGWTFEAAAEGDDLAHALDYQAVSERLVAHIEASQCRLLETLASQCAAILMGEFAVPWLRLQMLKPGAVPAAREVGVLIERSAAQQS